MKTKSTTIIELAVKRGSTATTYAGAWRYLRTHIPTPPIAAHLAAIDPGHRRPNERYSIGCTLSQGSKRNHDAKLDYLYESRAAAICDGLRLWSKDEAERLADELSTPMIKAANDALSAAWPYRRSTSRWAGGAHSVEVRMSAPVECGGHGYYASCSTALDWSSNGKWRGTNSSATVCVSRRALHYFPTLLAAGLIVVDCKLLAPREYRMTWIEQSTGVSLKTVSGYYLRGRHIVAKSLDDARKKMIKMRRAAARTELAKRVAKIRIAHPHSIWVTMDDSLAAGNCRAASEQVRRQVAEVIGAQGEFAARADVLLAVRHDDYARRAVARAAQRMSA